jgi:SAM-dependent methyltransferase
MLSVTRLKTIVKTRLSSETLMYNALAWTFGFMTGNPGTRRAAVMRVRKNGCFSADELHMASLLPTHLLDAVVARWNPHSFLDIGCGTGQTIKYLADKGIDCVGIEGSRAAIEASPVRDRILYLNLNSQVYLGRMFDIVWSHEVAQHIHPKYTDAFLKTLTSHGPVLVMSAAQRAAATLARPFLNEQALGYWIERLEGRGYSYLTDESAQLQSLHDTYARNVMVFVRQ